MEYPSEQEVLNPVVFDLYGRLYQAENEDLVKDTARTLRVFPVGMIIPMECTGHKDKNGSLIYGGDIVRREPVNRNAGGGGIYEIKWWPERSCYTIFNKFFPTDYHNKHYQLISKKIEIIGNIYENPNLCT